MTEENPEEIPCPGCEASKIEIQCDSPFAEYNFPIPLAPVFIPIPPDFLAYVYSYQFTIAQVVIGATQNSDGFWTGGELATFDFKLASIKANHGKCIEVEHTDPESGTASYISCDPKEGCNYIGIVKLTTNATNPPAIIKVRITGASATPQTVDVNKDANASEYLVPFDLSAQCGEVKEIRIDLVDPPEVTPHVDPNLQNQFRWSLYFKLYCDGCACYE